MKRLLSLHSSAPLLLVLAGVAVALACYLPTLHFPFVSDDSGYVSGNAKLAGLRFAELWRLFTTPYNDFSEYLPLRELSYWLDFALFGLDPAGFRADNLLLYLLSLPLVYVTTLAVWRYFRPADHTDACWAAAAVTALFALHPALVESVVWISGRKYVLPNLFALLAFWLVLRSKRGHQFLWPYALAALAAFVAVTLSKASYITVSLVIALLWLVFWLDIPAQQRRRSMLAWPVAIMLVTLLLAAVFMLNAQSYIADSGGSAPVLEMQVAVRSLAILGWLARLALSSESRHYFYPVLEQESFPVMAAFGAAVLAAILAGFLLLWRKRSLEGFALAVFFLLLLPYLQLIPYAPPSLVQDRFLSLAVWPAILLVVALAWKLKPLPRAAVLLLLALAWGFQLSERPRDWRSFESLVAIDMQAFPGYSMPAMYMTDFQLARGAMHEAEASAAGIADPEARSNMIKLVRVHQAVLDANASGDPRDAGDRLGEFAQELAQQPGRAKWNPALGIIWRVNRKYLEYEWRKLLGRFPENMVLRYHAGTALLAIQDFEGALRHLQVAAESPGLPEAMRGAAFYSLGMALLNSGQAADAEAALQKALNQVPVEPAAHCALAELYRKMGRNEQGAWAQANCTTPGANEHRPSS